MYRDPKKFSYFYVFYEQYNSSCITFTYDLEGSTYSEKHKCFLFNKESVAKDHLMLAIIALLQPNEILKQVGKSLDVLFYKGDRFPSNRELLKEEITFVLFKSGNELKIADGGIYFSGQSIKKQDERIYTLL